MCHMADIRGSGWISTGLKGPDPSPVLLFVYGGSWDSGHKEDYAFAARAFPSGISRGCPPSFRLVPDVHYPAFVDDVGSVIDWLAGNAGAYQGDGRKVFVVGHSAGAYNMVQAVVRNGLGVKVTAMASLAGPFDFLPLDSASPSLPLPMRLTSGKPSP